MEEKEIIKIYDEAGNEKEVEVIHYFTLESNDKDYLVYTEGSEDASGNVIVYTSEVLEKEDGIELLGVEDPQVLEEITKVLTEIVKS